MEEVDATSYGVLGVDTNLVLKQGLLPNPVTVSISPPATSGYSQYYIVQAIYNDVDGGPTVLPYWNAQNPSIPLGGPENSGQQQYTLRQGVCAVGLKAGVATTTGTQTIPPADAGYTPLWSILVSNGQTQITSANIAVIKDAPFISPKLTQVPPAIQAQKDNWAIDTGPSANVMQISLPGWTNVIPGLTLRIIKKVPSNTASPTLSINGGPPVTVAWADGNALQPGDWPAGAVGQVTFNGSNWELYTIAGPSIFARVGPGASPIITDASLLHYGIDTGTQNAAVCAAVAPTITSSVTVGITIEIQKIGTANSGSMTLAVTAAGGTVTAPLYWADGSAMQAGDWPASAIALVMFDGTYYRLLSVTHRPLTFPDGAYVHYGVASGSNTLTVSTTPVFLSMADGVFLELTPTQANSGPVTLSANGLSPSAVQTMAGNNLASGQLQPNQPALLMALGGVWKLFAGGGGGPGLTNIQVLVTSGTYTPTAGAQKALVFATGGGGAGGVYLSGGGGGGAGGTAIALVSMVGVSNVPYIIGAGGVGVQAPDSGTTNGGDGSSTSFGAYAAANGGIGGRAPTASTAEQSAAGGFGGQATLGAMLLQGGDGMHGVSTGVAGPIGGGIGGGSFWGGGGDGANSYQGVGSPGNAYGAGGGGGQSSCTIRTGGNGKSGVILVVEF
jgi:hypothetical protein